MLEAFENAFTNYLRFDLDLDLKRTSPNILQDAAGMSKTRPERFRSAPKRFGTRFCSGVLWGALECPWASFPPIRKHFAYILQWFGGPYGR